MKVSETSLPGVIEIEPDVFGDERGFFVETFHANRYREEAGLDVEFVQDNHSRSLRRILRGMHFQKNRPQGKLVRCVQGEVFDVVVDINPESSSYGKWIGAYLSGDNKKQLYVPPGYAHGFQVISESADFEYKCTDYYFPDDEGCLRWDDTEVGIKWPLANPIVSQKDKNGQSLANLDRA